MAIDNSRIDDSFPELQGSSLRISQVPKVSEGECSIPVWWFFFSPSSKGFPMGRKETLNDANTRGGAANRDRDALLAR